MADELKVVEAKVAAAAQTVAPKQVSWVAAHPALVVGVIAVVAVGSTILYVLFG